jgi:hypothetical protein
MIGTGGQGMQSLGERLYWGWPQMKVTNHPDAESRIFPEYRSGWTLQVTRTECARLAIPALRPHRAPASGE